MGEKNDMPRPGFNHFVTHKGQGKYFDTEFNFNGKDRRVVKGYYTTVVTDMAMDWIKDRESDKPWASGGTRLPQFLLPGKKIPTSLIPLISSIQRVLLIRRQASLVQKATRYLARDLWAVIRLAKKFLDESPEAVKDFANMVQKWGTSFVDDSVGRL